jgi:hypothetical protein
MGVMGMNSEISIARLVVVATAVLLLAFAAIAVFTGVLDSIVNFLT